MMREQLKAIREEAIKQIQDSGNLDKLNDVRVAFLGKKGQLTADFERYEGCGTGGAARL